MQIINVVARITTHLKHSHATEFGCCKLKKFNLLQHAALTCHDGILLRDNV